ncbi:MAG: tetratricopeptide repeat protein [Candidatus Omnitrophica bacterium]|nr:tetratricopeptide repeat protein [Candidatus Omnitrophota bacterium]MBU1923729.1 tetratricopeptide repeat protein [Candidatus Omnitrophota bacterium]
MNKIIILLCLGLVGCSTVPRDNKILRSTSQESGIAENTESAINTLDVPIDQKEIDDIIAIFSEAIKNNPNYAGAYYNRAVAYFHNNNYDKSWQDIHKAEALGINVDSKFVELVEKLKKASGRNR